jgi:hypothetical protein
MYCTEESEICSNPKNLIHMMTQSTILKEMFPSKDDVENSTLFPIEMIFAGMKSYYSAIMEQMEKKKKAMTYVQEDVFEMIDDEARRDAAHETDLQCRRDLYFGYSSFMTEQYCGEIINLGITYPQYFKRFFISQLYCFVETELKFICEYIQQQRNMQPENQKQEDSSVRIFEHIQYLLNINEIKKEVIEKELTVLENTRIVRNCIAHSLSVISEESKLFDQINDYAKMGKGLVLKKTKYNNNTYEIIIDGETFIEEFIESATTILKKLLENRNIITQNI